MALRGLERLTPLHSAVLVLREAFGCSLTQIASAFGCSPQACRRLLAAATAAGNNSGDDDLLPRTGPVTGPENAARLLATITPPLLHAGITRERCSLNGRPGSLFHGRDGQIHQTHPEPPPTHTTGTTGIRRVSLA